LFGALATILSPDVSPCLNQAARNHINSSQNFGSLIFDWVNAERKVFVVTAGSDPGEEEGFSGVGIISYDIIRLPAN